MIFMSSKCPVLYSPCLVRLFSFFVFILLCDSLCSLHNLHCCCYRQQIYTSLLPSQNCRCDGKVNFCNVFRWQDFRISQQDLLLIFHNIKFVFVHQTGPEILHSTPHFYFMYKSSPSRNDIKCIQHLLV